MQDGHSRSHGSCEAADCQIADATFAPTSLMGNNDTNYQMDHGTKQAHTSSATDAQIPLHPHSVRKRAFTFFSATFSLTSPPPPPYAARTEASTLAFSESESSMPPCIFSF